MFRINSIVTIPLIISITIQQVTTPFKSNQRRAGIEWYSIKVRSADTHLIKSFLPYPLPHSLSAKFMILYGSRMEPGKNNIYLATAT